MLCERSEDVELAGKIFVYEEKCHLGIKIAERGLISKVERDADEYL